MSPPPATPQLRVIEDERARCIDEADHIVAATLTLRPILERLAKVAVRRLAEWCLIQILQETGLELVASAHALADRADLARDLVAHRRSGSPFGVGHALANGEAVLVRDIAEAITDPRTSDPEELRIHHALGIRSAMFVPFFCGGAPAGVLRLFNGHERSRFSDLDLDTARQLAKRVACVYEVVHLFESRTERRALRDSALASTSHELRTPLGALMLSLESMGDDLIRRDVIPRSQLVIKTNRALRQARHLGDLIERQLESIRDKD